MGKKSETRTLAIGGCVLGVIAVGWFLLSVVVVRTEPFAAVVEALGVVLALLVLASVVGAVRMSLAARRDDQSTGT